MEALTEQKALYGHHNSIPRRYVLSRLPLNEQSEASAFFFCHGNYYHFEKSVDGGIFSNTDKKGAWTWYTFWNDLKIVRLLHVASLLFSLKLWLVITLFCPINMTM